MWLDMRMPYHARGGQRTARPTTAAAGNVQAPLLWPDWQNAAFIPLQRGLADEQ